MTEQDWAGRGFTGPPEPLSYADLDPKPLRQQLRDVLFDLGMATLTELESLFVPGVHRNDLIEELARMRDDGEVEFTGPRYKLVDRQAGN